MFEIPPKWLNFTQNIRYRPFFGGISKFYCADSAIFGQILVEMKLPCSFYLVKIANFAFVLEFMRIVIQENSKILNFEYEVIWKTSIRTKWFQLQLSTFYLTKVKVISDFFQKFLGFFFKNFKFWIWDHIGNSNPHKKTPSTPS
jgi:hypothetical protein